ncbi:MaoC family dehydratase [Pseudorhodoplanes sp.]|uniref:MaoC family dehydratase n=1 Tax=Pseudorhodoplanes sp. TaxID=1934341 RepID=UPI003D0DD0C8
MQQDTETTLPNELKVISIDTNAHAVRRYAELTHDLNPIHLDSDFAATTPFGAPIVHGTMSLNLLIEAIERTFKAMPSSLEMEVRFLRPVTVGMTIRASGKLLDVTTGTYEVFVETEAGMRAIEGTCSVTIARPFLKEK